MRPVKARIAAAVGALVVLATPLLASAAPAGRLVGHGAWSWFGDPRAVTAGGRTFVGWIDQRGDVRIAAYVHRSRRIVRGAVLKRGLGRDDHNNPSIVVRPDGRLMVFFSPHSGRGLPPPGIPSRMYYRLSRRPGDVRAFGPLRSLPTNTPGPLGYTYPNPVLAGRHGVRLFWRGGNWQPSTARWRAGRGWSRARTVLRAPGQQRPYVKYAPVPGGGGIALAFTEDNPGSRATSIRYARLVAGRRFRRASGATAGRMPLPVRQAERVYDGRGRGGRAWVLDVAVSRDRSHRPVILFVTLPSRREVVYRYATFRRGRWRVHRIAGGGPTIAGNYPAGGTLDHSDPSVAVLSRRVRGRYEISRWKTPDGGRSWRSIPITQRSGADNVRPVVPRGGGGVVVWMRGGYSGWRSYMTRVVITRGAKRRAVVAPPLALETGR